MTFQGWYKFYFFFVPSGRIGPPKLVITKKEDQIIVDIFHPLITVNENEPQAIYDDENTCYTFTYNVFVRINGSEVCFYFIFFKMEIFLLLA